MTISPSDVEVSAHTQGTGAFDLATPSVKAPQAASSFVVNSRMLASVEGMERCKGFPAQPMLTADLELSSQSQSSLCMART